MSIPAAPLVSPVRIVALSGSLRAGSYTRKALEVALEGVAKMKAETILVDLSETRLPPFAGERGVDQPEAREFRDQVRAADGLLIATPVYHDSYAGMLKNALDLLYEELAEKVAAVIAVGGGRVGQGQALEHLRAVLRETSTWVLPRQVLVPSSEEAFDPQGRPREPETETRLVALGQELVLRCRTMRRPRR